MKNRIKFSLLPVTVLLIVFFFAPLKANANLAPLTHHIDAEFGGAYCMLAGHFGGEITKQELATHDELEVAGCAAGSKIFQFTLRITKNSKTTAYKGKSHTLTKEMLAAIRSLSVGDYFEFKKMKAHLPKKEGIVDVMGKRFTVV